MTASNPAKIGTAYLQKAGLVYTKLVFFKHTGKIKQLLFSKLCFRDEHKT
jgi:hypothetical protein